MKTARSAKLLASSALLGVAMTFGAPALAQEAAASAPAAAGDGLQEITVTAQRRTENLQRVPLSIVAVTGEALKASGIQTLESLTRSAPNVVVERVGLFPGAASLSMRGIGYAGIESSVDPDVAVYVNGIYQPRNATALSQTLDLASVEILRGPQGTLFGRNAFAGAVSVQTARPVMGESSGSASATVGNYGLADFDVVANVPVSDKVAGRIALRQHFLAGLYRNNGILPGGAVDQTLVGQRIGRERSLVVRPSLRIQPTDNLDIQFIAEILRERDQASPTLSLPLAGSTIVSRGGSQTNPFGDKRLGIPSDGSDPYTTGFSLSGRPMNFDQQSYTTDITYTADGIGKFKLLGNYNKTKSEIWADTDGSVANIFSSTRYENHEAYSGELQFTSDFSDRLSLIAGAFAFHDSYRNTQISYTNTASANTPAVFNIASYLSPTSATCFGNQTTTVATGCTYPDFNVAYINNGGKRTAYAAYVQGEYHLTDPLSVVLGVRYSYERKYGYYGSNSALARTGLPLTLDPSLHTLPISDALPNGTPLIYRASPYKNSNWSPRVGLNYKVSDDILLFAFWQRAYKSGGFNATAADLFAFQNPYGTEKVDNFEAGIKSEFFDRKLRVNLNGFYAKYKGLQRTQVVPSTTAPSGVTSVTNNNADVTSYGIELEIAARPTRDLTLFLNAAYNKAKYTRYCADLNGAEATSTPALAPTLAVCGPVTTVTSSTGAVTYLVPQDYSNNRPLRAPQWDLTGGFTQNVAIGTGNLALTGSINFRSDMETDLLNRPYSYRPAMTTIDANVKWTPGKGNYSVTLWGRNLTNNVQVLGYTPVAPIFAFSAPTPPRQYGATLSVSF